MSPSRLLLALLLAMPAAAGAQTVSARLWRISLQAQTAEAAMPPVQVDQCLTEADAADPSQLLGSIASPGASGCAYSDRRYSGNTLQFAMECGGSFAIRASGKVAFTATTLSGTIDTSTTINGQRVELKNMISASRIADCGRS
jgi:hypothetical protein